MQSKFHPSFISLFIKNIYLIIYSSSVRSGSAFSSSLASSSGSASTGASTAGDSGSSTMGSSAGDSLWKLDKHYLLIYDLNAIIFYNV